MVLIPLPLLAILFFASSIECENHRQPKLMCVCIVCEACYGRHPCLAGNTKAVHVILIFILSPSIVSYIEDKWLCWMSNWVVWLLTHKPQPRASEFVMWGHPLIRHLIVTTLQSVLVFNYYQKAPATLMLSNSLDMLMQWLQRLL